MRASCACCSKLRVLQRAVELGTDELLTAVLLMLTQTKAILTQLGCRRRCWKQSCRRRRRRLLTAEELVLLTAPMTMEAKLPEPMATIDDGDALVALVATVVALPQSMMKTGGDQNGRRSKRTAIKTDGDGGDAGVAHTSMEAKPTR